MDEESRRFSETIAWAEGQPVLDDDALAELLARLPWLPRECASVFWTLMDHGISMPVAEKELSKLWKL
jgi:hypothetical protein